MNIETNIIDYLAKKPIGYECTIAEMLPVIGCNKKWLRTVITRMAARNVLAVFYENRITSAQTWSRTCVFMLEGAARPDEPWQQDCEQSESFEHVHIPAGAWQAPQRERPFSIFHLG